MHPATATFPPSWHVTVVDETGSTNADLLAEAAAGAPDRTVLAARHQTAGRGRLDRRWDAPPGSNLLVSMLFRTVPEHPHELTQRVALAACDATVELTGLHPTLKWPNDLLLDGRKLAGVLAQSGTSPDGSRHVVVGIGINVGWAPDDAARLGDTTTPEALLAALLRSIDALPDDIHTRYRNALVTLGQQVRVERPDGDVVGRAVDVGRDGRLAVIDECAVTHHIDTGDVIHLRLA
jgi:BirA family transcriptional regulator, biotin operon repressor / biotin---[acetyl-CoA-carboxylase] ligase